MRPRSTIIAILFSALVLSGGMIGAACAQDCPRGDLDKTYCDRDGDLVADAPTDPKQLINPGTLVFAYTPVEDPAVYAKAWDGFVKYMEEKTGKKVVFFPVQSNAAEIEAMRSGRCMWLDLIPARTQSRSIAPASSRLRLWAMPAVSLAMKWKSLSRPTARSRRPPI